MFEEEWELWEIVGLICGILAQYFTVRSGVEKCEYCGAWDHNFEYLELRDKGSYQSLDDVKVKREIYNNNNQEIAYFNDTKKELQTHFYKVWRVRCKKCGAEFTKYERN